MRISELAYRLFSPPLRGLLVRRGPLTAAFMRRTGLERPLRMLAVLLFRRTLVKNVNLFPSEWYAQVYPQAPRGLWPALWDHLGPGESEDRMPIYFFHTSWFRRQYAELLPQDVSPLVFFILEQRRLNLRPHWGTVFWGPHGIRCLDQDVSGYLFMHDRLSWEAAKLRSLDETPETFGWLEAPGADIGRVREGAEALKWPIETTLPSRTEALPTPAGIVGDPGPTLDHLDAETTGYEGYRVAMENVVAFGGETLMRLPDGTFRRDGNADAADIPHGIFAAYGFGVSSLKTDGRIPIWRGRVMPAYDQGLLLFQPADFNYNHWTVEGLTRLLPFLDQPGFKDLPIFITAGMPPSHEEMLRLLAPENPLIRVERHQAITVRRAWHQSEMCRYYECPDSPRKSYELRINLSVVKELRSRLLAAVDLAAPGRTPPKFIVHRSRSRGLKNSREIYDAAGERGFEIIRPETLSFAEQVSLFHNATHMLIPGGAACTNIMYAHEGAAAGVLSGAHERGFCHELWLAMAACSGAKLYALFGERGGDDAEGRRDSFNLPPNVLGEFLALTGLEDLP